MLWTALIAVWIAWGTTYLGIKWATETIPVFVMGGIRSTLAGGLMILAIRALGVKWPTRRQLAWTVLTGVILMAFSNGIVGVASRLIPSGLSALLAGVTPLWLVLMDWRLFGAKAPGRRVLIGIAIGITGLALLTGAASAAGLDRTGMIGLGLVAMAGGLWAFGSLLSRHQPHPKDMRMTAGLQLLWGGVGQLVIATALGEWSAFDPAAVSARSVWAVIYLVVIGSWVGFLSYVTVITKLPTALASTYAYVNPVVAVAAGWVLAGESVTPKTLLAAGILLAGVAVVATNRE